MGPSEAGRDLYAMSKLDLQRELRGAWQRLTAAEEALERSRRMLDETQQLAKLGSWERDVRTGRRCWSTEMFRIHGLEPDAGVLPKAVTDRLTHPDDMPAYSDWLEKIKRYPGLESEVTIRVLVSGEERTHRARGMMLLDDQGQPVRAIGTVQDVTDEVRAHQAEALLAQVVRSASDAIYTVGPDLLIKSWNPAAERLYGYPESEAVGRTVDMLIPAGIPPERLSARAKLLARVLSGEVPDPFEDRHTRSDRAEVDVIVACTPLWDIHGNVVGLIASTRDVTGRRRAEERVSHLASHDPVTDLVNRHRFQEEISAESAWSEQEGHQVAVLVLNLDNFKHVNESYGRDFGDQLVLSLTNLFRHCLSEGDVLARLGGAAFGVLQAPSDAAHASRLAEELLESVRNHAMIVDGCEVTVSTSIGITIFDGRDTNATELLRDLDRAMFENKERGRDRVTVYSDADRIDARQKMRSHGEHIIRDALRKDQLELFAQPIVNLTTGVTSQLEVLLRMRRDGGLVSPAEFLPVAERFGLMHLVDFWVISHAMAVAARYPDLTFNINLSGATIDDERLGSVVAQELRISEADPRRIVFELTETAAIRDMGRAREMAQQLASLGCKFAIDDFGAGFGSFYYLKHFPAHYVKIDGEFVKDPGSRMNQLMIESTVAMAKELGKETIAEFVADAATFEQVRTLGVDHGQGYHFAKPFPIEQLQGMPRQLLDRTQPQEELSPTE